MSISQKFVNTNQMIEEEKDSRERDREPKNTGFMSRNGYNSKGSLHNFDKSQSRVKSQHIVNNMNKNGTNSNPNTDNKKLVKVANKLGYDGHKMARQL